MTGNRSKSSLLKLAVAALGIVYGDIGTSPLYTVRICFSDVSRLAPSQENVFGVLALIFWALAILIGVKYMIFVLRADNKGEGGILALMTLIHRHRGRRSGAGAILLLGVLGATLLYGEGLITPVITVVSAVEGLSAIAPITRGLVLPMATLILISLFVFQKRGSGAIGSVFGPIMLVWFLVIGALGALAICRTPGVLAAINPQHAFRLLANHEWRPILLTLSAVFLALTGGETLYADMGHFGKRPIRLGWFFLVFPCVALNYFGQGAHLLEHPGEVENLFYRLAPAWALTPCLILATVASVIASQAVISGAFSLTRQAVQLGFLPRVNIKHTSAETIGQIYAPIVNLALLAGTLLLLFNFRKSEDLAGAYGIAVSTTMLITTGLMFFYLRRVRAWGMLASFGAILPFLAIDATFCCANLLKVGTGGWIPLVIAAVLCLVMTTWVKGRAAIQDRLVAEAMTEDLFFKDVERHQPARVPGTAVFLAGTPHSIPRTLLHNFKHNKIFHERVVFLTVITEEFPVVPPDEQVKISDLGQGFYRLLVYFGFTQDPDIPAILGRINHPPLDFAPMRTTYFVGRETIVIGKHKNMRRWRKELFAFLSRNALDASKFFRIPPGRVVEFGLPVEI